MDFSWKLRQEFSRDLWKKILKHFEVTLEEIPEQNPRGPTEVIQEWTSGGTPVRFTRQVHERILKKKIPVVVPEETWTLDGRSL